MDYRIAEYVKEVSQPGIPYVNHSHETLCKLYCQYGKQVIDDLLAAHWNNQRNKCPPGHFVDPLTKGNHVQPSQ